MPMPGSRRSRTRASHGGTGQRRADRRLPDHESSDFYTATIDYRPRERCLESKSLKLYLSRFRDQGVFCEQLAVQIRDEVAAALALDASDVKVTLVQKPRGGITITASA